jgi:signal transduction histidine kinase
VKKSSQKRAKKSLRDITGKSQTLESANRRLNRLVQEQNALREIFTQINLLDLGHLLHQLTEQALRLLQVDHIQVRLVDSDGTLKTVALAGAGAERFRDRVGSSGTGRSSWVMENRRPLAIRDIRQDKIYGPGRLMREMGVKGFLSVPLIARDQKSIGVLLATSLEEKEFSPEEIALAQQLAAGAAVAIENARLFEELQKKSQELEEAYKTKSAFLNTMAHELRTPLNVLIATLQLFAEGFYGDLSEQQIKGLEPMQRNAVNLLNLIASILDLARLEAKRVPVQVEEFQLKELIDELESSFLPLAREKGIAMRVRLDEPGLTLKSDKMKIRAVLQNLLGNAVKYTDRGEIDVHFGTLPAADGPAPAAGLLRVEVTDTGIGIKERDLPHIFEAFYMAEGISRRKYPGSGLGLCIVKRLLELMRGEIQVKSEWGKGSVFTATLPLEHPADNDGAR